VGYAGLAGVIPVPVAQVVAGQPGPVTASYLSLDLTLVPSAECYLVAVTDDDARELGVRAGDLALVHPVARSREGEPVVVRIGGRAVVRTMVRRGQAVVLHAGDGVDPLELGPRDDYAVLGVLAGIIRPPAARAGDADRVTDRDTDRDSEA
jgi:repressor LexA